MRPSTIAARLTQCGRGGALSLLLVLGAESRPAWGFDTHWHMHATERALAAEGYSAHATHIVHIGNFAPDFYQAIYQHVLGKRVEELNAQVLLSRVPGLGQIVLRRDSSDQKRLAVRRAADFMHFSDLYDDLDSNAKFEILVSRLLASTKQELARHHENQMLSEETRKVLILTTLGSSLHAIQDFCSHTTWIHLDWESEGLSFAVTTRPPTWFEVRDALAARGRTFASVRLPLQADTFPYPVEARRSAEGVPKIHPYMSHDSSTLLVDGHSVAEYHHAGIVSAVESPEQHQGLAVAMAIEQSIQWIRAIETDDRARAALQFGRDWGRRQLVLEDEAESAKLACFRVSCLIGHWDGDPPPAERLGEVRALLRLDLVHQIAQLVRGGSRLLPDPLDLYWSAYSTHDVLERLTEDLGDPLTSRYRFAPSATSPPPASTPSVGTITLPPEPPASTSAALLVIGVVLTVIGRPRDVAGVR